MHVVGKKKVNAFLYFMLTGTHSIRNKIILVNKFKK